MYTLFSVDVALNKTGVAVLAHTGEFLFGEVVTVPAGWEYYRKLEKLYEQYTRLFDKALTANGGPLILLVEGRLKAGWSANAMASIEGARVACALAYMHFCSSRGFKPEIHSYDPNTIKLSISGKRNANKDELRESALSSYSFLRDVEYQEDIFDAIYLALHHTKEHNERTGRSKKKSGV